MPKMPNEPDVGLTSYSTRAVSRHTVRQRMRRGMSRAEAMSAPVRGHFLTDAAGRTQRLSAWAKELGIAESSILGRLKRGWTEAEAVTCPKSKRISPAELKPLVAGLVRETLAELGLLPREQAKVLKLVQQPKA